MPINTFIKRVGRNIRAARIRAGLRQIDVNEKSGLTYRHYQDIEAGKINVTIATLCRLSRLFSAKVTQLVEDC